MASRIEQIDAYLDGTLDDEAARDIERLIVDDPDFVSLFTERSFLHDRLRSQYALDRAVPHRGRAEAGESTKADHFRIAPATVGIAAALLLSAAIVAIYAFIIDTQSPALDPSSPPIATLIESTGTLMVDNDIASPGGEYPSGAYALDRGSAEFLLTNRVTVRLRGETRLRVRSPRSVKLARGTADFKVPHGVTGFTVHLPDRSTIVDLGTAFRVTVDEDGATMLRVTEGSVAWNRPADSEDTTAERVVLAREKVARIIDGRIEIIEAPSLIAYHDFGGEPSPGHVTTQISLDNIVRLVDHFDGAKTGIELTLTGANVIDDRTDVTRAPAAGTPAHDLFAASGLDLNDGVVSVGGKHPSKRMTLKLARLDPAKRYDLALYGDRDQPADGPERFTLTGVESATNASSTGVIDAITTSLETRPNAERGHVVRWTDIAPGDDGAIEVQVQVADTNLAYVSAMRLSAVNNDTATHLDENPTEPKEEDPTEKARTEGDPQ